MLLDLPKGSANRVRARIYASLAQLEQVLDSSDRQQYANLFQMDGRSDDGLQPRRGYMLGYLIAQELGKSRLLMFNCTCRRLCGLRNNGR